MKIFLDARFYNRSGIGRYIEGLYNGIFDDRPDIKVIAAGKVSLLRGSLFKTQDITPFDAPIYSLSEQIKGSLLMKKFNKDVDVFHIPHYNAPWFLPKNSVVTIHDMTQFLFPKLFGKLKRSAAGIVLRNALKKAGRIITDSESTKKDLKNYYPEFAGKIKVIYPGISGNFKPLSDDNIIAFKKSKGINDYILYVGNRKPTKNINRLLEAFSIIKKKYHDLQIIIIGEKFSKIDEVDVLRKQLSLKGDTVKEVIRVSDEELLNYYCGAKVLAHPSLYEGFGFTPLEAMACGCPVVVSNISSLPEVCGDAAYYVDPYNVENIAEGMAKVLIDENLRNTLVQNGFERIKLFNWEKAAKDALKVFEEVIQNNP